MNPIELPHIGKDSRDQYVSAIVPLCRKTRVCLVERALEWRLLRGAHVDRGSCKRLRNILKQRGTAPASQPKREPWL